MGDAIPVLCSVDDVGQSHSPVWQVCQADGEKHLQCSILLCWEHVHLRQDPGLRVRGSGSVVQVLDQSWRWPQPECWPHHIPQDHSWESSRKDQWESSEWREQDSSGISGSAASTSWRLASQWQVWSAGSCSRYWCWQGKIHWCLFNNIYFNLSGSAWDARCVQKAWMWCFWTEEREWKVAANFKWKDQSCSLESTCFGVIKSCFCFLIAENISFL